MSVYEDIALDLARIERQALDAVRARIASRQLGEAWVDLFHDGSQDRPLVARQATLSTTG